MVSKLHALKPGPADRANVLSDNQTSFPWNVRHLESSKAEWQHPVKDIALSIKDRVLNVFREGGKLATDAVTGIGATIANAARYVVDVGGRLPARIAVIATDTIGEKIGQISTWFKKRKEALYKRFEPSNHGHGAHGVTAHLPHAEPANDNAHAHKKAAHG